MKSRSEITILLVDDEPDLARSLADYLEDCDFTTCIAGNGEKGLTLLDQGVDLAIVDLRLPGMAGTEFIRQAKERQPGMHFFIHTGSADFSVNKECEGLGLKPEHLFLKPVQDLTILVDAIDSLFGSAEESNT